MYYVCVCVFRGTQQRTYHGVLYINPSLSSSSSLRQVFKDETGWISNGVRGREDPENSDITDYQHTMCV